jgi:hypothetical protein
MGFDTPYSLLPTPYSLLPTPYSLLPSMDRLSPPSIAQSIAHNQIRDQRQQRQWTEAEVLLERLGLAGSADCAVYLSNSLLEKQCTRWLETRVEWWVDRGSVRVDWGRCPADRSRSAIETSRNALMDSAFTTDCDRLGACLTDLGVESNCRVTVHWFNFCDPVLELPLVQLRPCLGAIARRGQPVWLFDRQANWCVEYWPMDGSTELRWGNWPWDDRR